MLIQRLPVGNMEANCYVVADETTLDCAVIDPGDESNTILDYVEDRKLRVRAIFLTHGHFDHWGAANTVAEETGAPVWVHEADCAGAGKSGMFVYPPAPEVTVKHYKNGDILRVGELYFGVLETPGHSPGSVCLLCEDSLFTGDVLFRGTVGRTDLPGGDMNTLMKTLRRLAQLPENYDVYPGHMEVTTLDRERSTNGWMQAAMGGNA